MSYPGMICSARIGEQVKGDTESPPAIKELLMVFISYFLRCDSFFLSPNCDGCTVLVTPRDHQNFVAFKAVVASKNICRQVGTGNMP